MHPGRFQESCYLSLKSRNNLLLLEMLLAFINQVLVYNLNLNEPSNFYGSLLEPTISVM